MCQIITQTWAHIHACMHLRQSDIVTIITRTPQAGETTIFILAGPGNPMFDPFPYDKLWALTKLKALAENKFNVAKMLNSLFARVENIAEKRENDGYQHFLLFPQSFQKAYFLGYEVV